MNLSLELIQKILPLFNFRKRRACLSYALNMNHMHVLVSTIISTKCKSPKKIEEFIIKG